MLAAVRPGDRVVALEVGGKLHSTPDLARILDGAVYGLDIDPEMLAQARAALEAAGAGVRGLICGDARDLPGPSPAVGFAEVPLHPLPHPPGLHVPHHRQAHQRHW